MNGPAWLVVLVFVSVVVLCFCLDAIVRRDRRLEEEQREAQYRKEVRRQP